MSRKHAALALLVLLSAGACGRDHEKARDAEAHAEGPKATRPSSPDLLEIDPGMVRDLRITVAKAEARAGGEGVKLIGEVAVNEAAYAELGVSIPARVVKVLVSPGDRVQRGQALAELQSAELGNARAAYLSARARAEVARAAFARKQELSGRVVPVREVQAAEAESRAADAEVQAAAVALYSAGVSEKELVVPPGSEARLILRSPASGVVIERNCVVGQMTDPARPLFRVGDLSRLWVVVHAFERDAVRIRPAAAARVSFPALPGRVFPGEVKLIGRQVEVSSRTIPVRIEVENAEGALRPGMSGTAWVPFGDLGDRVVAVPTASLQRMQDEWRVFLPKGEGQFEIRTVGRGRDLGGEVEILSGLRPDETVVVEGAFLLKAEAEKSKGEGEQHEH